MKKYMMLAVMLIFAVTVQAQDYYPSGNIVAPTWSYYSVVDVSGDFYNPHTKRNGSVISDGTVFSSGNEYGDAYDGAFEFFVNISDSVYTNGSDSIPGSVDTTGTTFSLAEQLINGLYVSKQYYFSPSTSVVRAVFKIRNPTATDISEKIGISTNLGSDNNTTMDTSATDGDSLVNADRWMVTWDGMTLSDPVNTWVRFGPGTVAVTPVFGKKPENGSGYFLDTLAVTIPANSYILLMQFNRIDSTVAAARAYVGTFNTVESIHDAGFLSGMTNEELDKVVNWDFSSLTCTVDTTVTAIDLSLMANASGMSYQWLDCANGYAVIPGATSQSFVPTVDGNYAVEITGACTDTSACYTVAGIGMEDISAVALSVSPNPSTGTFTITTGVVADEINIFDVLGNQIMKLQPETNRVSIDLNNYSEGLYVVEMTINHQKKFARIAITR